MIKLEKSLINEIQKNNQGIENEKIEIKIKVNPGTYGYSVGYKKNGEWNNIENIDNKKIGIIIFELYDEITKNNSNRWNELRIDIEKEKINFEYIWNSKYQDQVNSYNEIKWDGYNMNIRKYGELKN